MAEPITDWNEMFDLCGHRATILLSWEDTKAWLVGTLLNLTPDGEVMVLLDDGTTTYAWPALGMIKED